MGCGWFVRLRQAVNSGVLLVGWDCGWLSGLIERMDVCRRKMHNERVTHVSLYIWRCESQHADIRRGTGTAAGGPADEVGIATQFLWFASLQWLFRRFREALNLTCIGNPACRMMPLFHPLPLDCLPPLAL